MDHMSGINFILVIKAEVWEKIEWQSRFVFTVWSECKNVEVRDKNQKVQKKFSPLSFLSTFQALKVHVFRSTSSLFLSIEFWVCLSFLDGNKEVSIDGIYSRSKMCHSYFWHELHKFIKIIWRSYVTCSALTFQFKYLNCFKILDLNGELTLSVHCL